jgi:pimeloyl-ACP methyl ester carboxylesterase
VTDLAYDDGGRGAPVLFIAGAGGAGRTWQLHQAPALQKAGYRVITFDNRGIGATEQQSGFGTATMVADTAALIEELVGGPVRLVSVSMGSYIAQELMLARPELVTQAVLLATRGRLDRTRAFFNQADSVRLDSGVQLPPEYHAKVRMLESFSPKTLNDDRVAGEWLEMFTMFPVKPTAGARAQLRVAPTTNRLAAYRGITNDVLVVGFADDVVTPPYLGAEVADVMPNARYLEIPDTGHLGFIERPDVVNAAILAFFGTPGV